MARPLRIEYPGALYHVTSRGNARDRIFQDDQDKRAFLSVLGSVIEKYHWFCHAYCLMDNHYHLLVETPDGNLSRGMRQLNGVYTEKFNTTHKRPGHIFQGRYKAILVDKDSYLLELNRYIVLNPVRAHLVERPEDWVWSSYCATGGLSESPGHLTVDWILGMFAEQRKVAQRQYRDFVLQGLRNESPWAHVRGQILLGNESFVERFRDRVGNQDEIQEISREQRYAGRPELRQLFAAQTAKDRKKRAPAIRQAHVQYGYTLKEIADHLGIHYTTVSKIVHQAEEEN